MHRLPHTHRHTDTRMTECIQLGRRRLMHIAYGMGWNSGDDANYYYDVRISSVHSAAVWSEKTKKKEVPTKDPVLLGTLVIRCPWLLHVHVMQRAYSEKNLIASRGSKWRKTILQPNVNWVIFLLLLLGLLQLLHRLCHCHAWFDFFFARWTDALPVFATHPIKIYVKIIEAQQADAASIICTTLSFVDECHRPIKLSAADYTLVL